MLNSTKLMALALTMAVLAPIDAARGGASGQEQGVIDTLKQYEVALNASDTGAVMQLYTTDGVFMPQYFPSAVGSDAVRAAYDGVFAAIKLDISFDIVEVVQISPDWAFARTNSAGSITVLANDQGGPAANQELFVLQRVDGGDWKIARYAFSATNPPSN